MESLYAKFTKETTATESLLQAYNGRIAVIRSRYAVGSVLVEPWEVEEGVRS